MKTEDEFFSGFECNKHITEALISISNDVYCLRCLVEKVGVEPLQKPSDGVEND